MDEDLRKKVSQEVVRWYENDKEGREEWDQARARWYDLTHMKPPPRTKPWEDAADVVVPIMASASQQFSARAYASIFNNPDESVAAFLPVEPGDVDRARNVGKFINWQLLAESAPDYEREWDLMLTDLPIMGTSFKKTTWDFDKHRPHSEYVSAVNVFVPNTIARLQDSPHIIHRSFPDLDELKDLGQAGFYAFTEDLDRPSDTDDDESEVAEAERKLQGTDTTDVPSPNVILECYAKWQLPEDETPRQYIAWVDKTTGTLLRMTPREIRVDGQPMVLGAWTDYHFIPNSQGFYSYGYGHVLEEMNLIANAVFNQYIDSGRLSNTPFVVYSRRAQLKSKDIKIRPGGAVEVGDVSQFLLQKFPGLDAALPNLLGVVERYVQQLTSNTDELQGRAPRGVREPTVGGTLARIDQGILTFGVIGKRILRQYRQELRQIFELNMAFLFGPEEKKKVFRVLGTTANEPFAEVKREDFRGRFDITPTGSPSLASPQQRKLDAQEVMQVMLQHPLVVGVPEAQIPPNVLLLTESLKNYLREQGQGDLAKFVPDAPPPSLSIPEEHARFLEGDEVLPKQGEPHAEHLAQHLLFAQTPEWRSLSDQKKQSLETHVEVTRAMAALEERQQIDAQNLGGGNGDVPQG